MTKRLQVLLDEEEYAEIQTVARRQRMTVAAWVRQTLREARGAYSGAADSKLRAIADGARHEYPTADIDDMLRQIDDGRRIE